MSESSVKVGVRIRPLVGEDSNDRIDFVQNDLNQISTNSKTFTFDYLFQEDVNQSR